MKNTAILLILLFSVLGLVIGVCYTTDDTGDISQASDDIGLKSESDNIIIHLKKAENESSLFAEVLS